jgi:hypothetical protein
MDAGELRDLLNAFAKELNTLSVDAPEGLDEAAEELFETIQVHEHENIFDDTFKKIFIAGAEWRDKQSPKLPSNLDEAAEKYALDNADDSQEYESGYLGFKAGAEWLLQGPAVDGVVHHYASVHYIFTDQKQLSARLKKFAQDEEVKIFIVKAKKEQK